MNVELSCGGKPLVLEIPSNIRIDTFAPGRAGKVVTLDSVTEGFLGSSADSLQKSSSPLIVVNDAYRNTPTGTILQWLREIVPTAFDRATFLVSTGTHPRPTEQQFPRIFGELWQSVSSRVAVHDCSDRDSMVLLGQDDMGGEVRVNTLAVESDCVLVISSVEPHYFAGFTGGRKSIFPGLADFDTIARNHNLANSLEAAPLRLTGNPVAEHLGKVFSLLDRSRFFGVQAVVDVNHHLAGLFCGQLDAAFTKATKLAEQIYSHTVTTQYDIVVCEILPPLDSNLYQAQKALENTQAAVVDGGTAIIVSACHEGIGSSFFYDLAGRWDRETNRARDGKEYFGSHKLSRVNSISRRINVHLFSTLKPDIARRVFYEPLDNVQGFLYSKSRECEICNMAVVRDAAHTVLKRSN